MGRNRLLTLKNKDKIKERLESNRYILEPEGCWLWIEFLNPAGYGQLTIEGKSYGIHRLSLYVYTDFDLSSELIACHKVFCKRKNCFNPEHLYAGTHSNNAIDIILIGDNKNAKKTHCPKGHEYTPQNTQIRHRYNRTNPTRECRICCRQNLRNSRMKGKRGELLQQG
jgi:hypothetical protein